MWFCLRPPAGRTGAPARAQLARLVAVIVVLFPSVVGCARTQQGRVYSMADGRTSLVVVERPFGGNGSLRTALPDGEICSGDFSEVAFSDVAGMAACNVPLTDNAEAGIAVLTCRTGNVLRCTLARRYDDGFSYGACKDQRGAEYNLMF
jgi:hypothetical protein